MLRDVINRIKLFLNEEIEQEVQLTDVKTTDGIILSFEGELAVDKDLFIVDEAGREPAPDGEYILEDGTKISAMDGKVAELEAPEIPVEEMPEPEMAPEVPVEAAEVDLAGKIDELVKKIKKCEDDNLALAEIVKQLAEGMNEKSFKEEVKMNMVTPDIDKVEIHKHSKLQKSNDLNTIFKNMYK